MRSLLINPSFKVKVNLNLYLNLKLNFALCFVFVVLMSSCEKDRKAPVDPNARSEERLLMDSIYYYYNAYSLWTDDSIPDYELPAQFTDAFQTKEDVLTALTQRTPYYPAYGGPIDRFSYMVNATTTQGTSTIDTQSGMGLYVSIGAISDTLAYPIIYFVEPGSAAAAKGIRRSDMLLKLKDNIDLSVPVTCDDNSCTATDPARYSAVVSLVFDAINSSTMDLTLLRNDRQQLRYVLQSSTYEIAPFYKDTIFRYPEKRIGYLGLSTFADIENSATNKQAFEDVFKRFEQGNVEELIVDMRYNTGGYVATASYLANKVIPAEDDGKLMFSYAVNQYLESQMHSADFQFAPEYFKRQNALSLKRVYFLVSKSTASAAELYINILKAYMPVYIIAEQSHTYGKPVGYFPQTLMNKVDLWVASFKLVNALGTSDYWNGIAADKAYVDDYIFKDFGDSQETMIATALAHSLSSTRLKVAAPSVAAEAPRKKVELKKINSVPIRVLHK